MGWTIRGQTLHLIKTFRTKDKFGEFSVKKILCLKPKKLRNMIFFNYSLS